MPLTTIDERVALVVVDLQQGSLARPAAPHPVPDVIARAAELASTFRAHALPVVLTRFTVAVDGSDATSGRTDLGGATRPPPPGWDTIVDELAGHANDLVVTKRNWGSFYGTDLDLRLRRRGVTQIVLCGLATSLGVESTARAAHEHGYHVTTAIDAMSDLAAEAHHHAVGRIFPMLSETATTAEIITQLAARESIRDQL